VGGQVDPRDGEHAIELSRDCIRALLQKQSEQGFRVSVAVEAGECIRLSKGLMIVDLAIEEQDPIPGGIGHGLVPVRAEVLDRQPIETRQTASASDDPGMIRSPGPAPCEQVAERCISDG
jgi:hypothetical protein